MCLFLMMMGMLSKGGGELVGGGIFVDCGLDWTGGYTRISGLGLVDRA